MPRLGRRQQEPPPPVYQDGLIPTAGDYHNYPEVVTEDNAPTKTEKSYPELAADPPRSGYPQRPPQAVSPPSTEGTVVQSPLAAPPMIGNLPLPRTSAVHSLRQAWSLNGEDDGMPPEERVPLWKRPIFWVIVLALIIIITLAGILGGVATGSIKTAANSSAQTSPSPSPSASSSSTPTPASSSATSSGTATPTASTIPSVTDPTCPSANNRNYTAATNQKTFRIQCSANYPGGDGSLGLQNATQVTTNISTFGGCLDLCAQKSDCVGAVFNTGLQCWLKQAIGLVDTGVKGTDSAILWQ